MLGVIEQQSLGFNIKRVYYLFDIKSGSSRGGHAHKTLRQCLIPLSGSFIVTLDNGQDQALSHQLRSPRIGLIVPPGYWRTISDFSAGSVCLVLASAEYSSQDYIRDYKEFIRWANKTT